MGHGAKPPIGSALLVVVVGYWYCTALGDWCARGLTGMGNLDGGTVYWYWFRLVVYFLCCVYFFCIPGV